MAAKTTWAKVVSRMGGDEGRLTQYAKGDTSSSHPNFDTALAVADGQMRSRITFRYTQASYDAWTDQTIPDYVRFHLESLLLGVLTASDDSRPDQITVYAGIAAGWLDDVVKDNAKIVELVEVSGSATGGGGNVGYSAPDDPVFTRSATRAPTQDFNFRDDQI